MKAEDMKNQTKDELVKTLFDLKKQQFNLRLQRAQGQLENSAQIRVVRRDIARAQTFLNQAGEEAASKTAKKAPAKKAAAKKAPAKKAAKKTA